MQCYETAVRLDSGQDAGVTGKLVFDFAYLIYMAFARFEMKHVLASCAEASAASEDESELPNESARLLFQLSQKHLNLATAQRLLEQAQTLEPGSFACCFMLGKILHKLGGAADRVLSLYQRAMAMVPSLFHFQPILSFCRCIC